MLNYDSKSALTRYLILTHVRIHSLVLGRAGTCKNTFAWNNNNNLKLISL